MSGIAAPPAETAWLLRHVLGFQAMPEADTAAVLTQATRFAADVLAPLDAPGDAAGAVLAADGTVRAAPGFADALRRYAQDGWIGIAADPDHSGQGLPAALALAAFEPVSAANMAFGLCPMLTQDAIALLEAHGSEDQKARFLPPLIDGRCTGTMCLTEPDAGSDLSGVRTLARPDGSGRWRVTGAKIYITWGAHDLTPDVLHMVLARTPDAPAGSGGISLFAVPARRPDGTRNGVHCTALERKLGIHASPTCALAFDHAAGELVGELHRGLPAMFAMMNAARLGVAMQGVAAAERAFRRAAAYAAARVQGGAPIGQHPDVRRMLLTMRALALGGRLLTLSAALAPPERAALLIPVAKAWCTEAGVEAASLGVQVHGGAGYVEATGAAQHLRDARITPIYEGTNGIQALTLLRRGLLRDNGASVAALLDDTAAAPGMAEAVDLARRAAATLAQRPARAAEAGATPFLHLLGTVAAGALCARAAAARAPDPARIAAEAFADLILPRAAAFGGMVARPCRDLAGLAAIT